MRDHNKLARDFDVRALAKETKNFSGAEIEGLVRAATSTAMNRLIKVKAHSDTTIFFSEGDNDFLAVMGT